MTRIVVAYENKPYVDGRTIASGALYVEEDRIPVALYGNLAYPVGVAKHFQRDVEKGEISFDIRMGSRHQAIDPLQYSANVFLSPFESEMVGKQLIVTKGRIREITLS